MKKIIFELGDGRTYSVLADMVARDRATYYAEKDKSTTFEEEYNYTMSSDSELLDWVVNNMNWYDLNPTLEASGSLCDLCDAEIEDFYVEKQ